ncbi:MAG: hypothetical protein M3R00_06210 [Pseudomonadota bacterium]|nr:hypothetical protein [Pseudomonadota bacterium]
MSLIAAFLWDSSAKSVAHMVVDSKYCSISRPKKKTLDKPDSFRKEADGEIEIFFNELKKEFNRSPGGKIRIEFKIIGNATPAFPTSTNKVGNESKIINKIFRENVENNSNICSLTKQLRKKLSKEARAKFKEGLVELEYIVDKKGEAYMIDLWALATHATEKTFEKCLKKLDRAKNEDSLFSQQNVKS